MNWAIDLRPSLFRPGRWGVPGILLLTLLTLAGCGAPAIAPPEAGVAPELLAQRYAEDQQQRLQGSRFWRVRGILDLETPRFLRRSRFLIHGEGTRQALLLVFGPMNQVALTISLNDAGLRLVNGMEREVVEVPPTLTGMEYLTGLPISPVRLLGTLLARAEPLAGGHPDGEGWWRARDGEELRLDPRGRPRERRTAQYTAHYQWEEGADRRPPAELMVELADGGHMKAILERWDDPGEGVPPPAPPPAHFALHRPFQAPGP